MASIDAIIRPIYANMDRDRRKLTTPFITLVRREGDTLVGAAPAVCVGAIGQACAGASVSVSGHPPKS